MHGLRFVDPGPIFAGHDRFARMIDSSSKHVQLLGVERPENSPTSHGKLPSDGQRRAAGIIFYGNGSAGATGRRCRYKLAASGGSAGCVRQLQAPIWVTPIAGGHETAKNRGIFATLPHRAE